MTVSPVSMTSTSDAERFRPRVLSVAECTKYAQDAGFKAGALPIAVAIAGAESDYHTDAVGDVIAHPEPWMLFGRGAQAIGLWQIVPSTDDSLGETQVRDVHGGTHSLPSTGPRDFRQLRDPAFNAKSAYVISKGGTDWTPWSTWWVEPPSKKNPKGVGPGGGVYRKYLSAAKTFSGTTGDIDAATGDVYDVFPKGGLYAIRLGGQGLNGELGRRVIGGTLDLSTQETSELSLTFEDAALDLMKRWPLTAGTSVDVNRQRMQVMQVSRGSTNGVPTVTIRAQPEGVIRLQHTTPADAANVSATQYVQGMVTRAGLSFVGLRTAVGTSYGPKPVVTATAASGILNGTDLLTYVDPYAVPAQVRHTESAWQLIQRLATEKNFQCWEALGTVYFGDFAGLLSHGSIGDPVTLSWHGWPVAGGVPLMDAPQITASDYQPAGGTAGSWRQYTLKATYPREYLNALRPGRSCHVNDPGFPSFRYIVTRLSFDLTDATAPIKLEAQTITSSLAAATGAVAGLPSKGSPTTQESDTGGSASASAQARGAAAIERARTEARSPDPSRYRSLTTVTSWHGNCLIFVRCCFGVAGRDPSAAAGWANARYKHPGDLRPPPGVPVWWAGGSRQKGHVALTAGGGFIYSSDWPNNDGRVGLVKLEDLNRRWGNLQYQGWTEDINGVRVYTSGG